MTYSEAVSLTRTLLADPSSHVAASVAGWQHPETREALILKDAFDLAHAQAARRKPDPYPRGYDVPKRRGDNVSLPKDQLKALLDRHRGINAGSHDG